MFPPDISNRVLRVAHSQIQDLKNVFRHQALDVYQVPRTEIQCPMRVGNINRVEHIEHGGDLSTAHGESRAAVPRYRSLLSVL